MEDSWWAGIGPYQFTEYIRCGTLEGSRVAEIQRLSAENARLLEEVRKLSDSLQTAERENHDREEQLKAEVEDLKYQAHDLNYQALLRLEDNSELRLELEAVKEDRSRTLAELDRVREENAKLRRERVDEDTPPAMSGGLAMYGAVAVAKAAREALGALPVETVVDAAKRVMKDNLDMVRNLKEAYAQRDAARSEANAHLRNETAQSEARQRDAGCYEREIAKLWNRIDELEAAANSAIDALEAPKQRGEK